MENPSLPDFGPLSQEIHQDELSPYVRIAYDAIISPTKLNHFMVYFNRFHNWFNNVHRDTNGAAALGIQGYNEGVPGAALTPGYPEFLWGGGPIVSLSQPGRASLYNNAQNVYGIMDTFNWSHGSHFMKIGFDGSFTRYLNQGSYNPTFTFSPLSTSLPNYAFSGNLTGFSFASYLLGTVYSASLTRPVPVTDDSTYAAGFFQDDYKATSRLTFSLGLRWDWTSAINEAHGRLDGWTSQVTDPLSGLPGAYVFASGSCPTCFGGKYLGKGSSNRFVPRIGMAYRISSSTTVRGGYSIFNQTYSQPVQNLGRNLRNGWTGTWQTTPPASNAWAGIFNIDQGIPASLYSPATFNASYGDANGPAYFSPQYPVMPYIQHWNLNVQHSFGKNWVLDAGYIGVKGTKLRGDTDAALDQLNPSYLQEFGTKLLNPVTNAAQAAANGIAYPYPGFSGTVASALRQYPQIVGNSTIANTGAPWGFSTTEQLQAVVEKRIAYGLSAYANYVWSKTLTNVDTGYNGGLTPQNVYDLKAEKAIADYDVPWAVKGSVVYELPVGKGKALLPGAGKVLNGLVGGWELSAIVQYQAGLPLIFTTSSSPLAGAWNGGVRINIASAANMKASGFSTSNFSLANTAGSSNTYLNKADFSDVQALSLGTAAYAYSAARAFPTRSENIALAKNFRIREKVRMQLRADALDALNRHTLGGIVTNVTNALFGQVTSVSGNRTVQVAARLDF
jgi:hypothetical protein